MNREKIMRFEKNESQIIDAYNVLSTLATKPLNDGKKEKEEPPNNPSNSTIIDGSIFDLKLVIPTPAKTSDISAPDNKPSNVNIEDHISEFQYRIIVSLLEDSNIILGYDYAPGFSWNLLTDVGEKMSRNDIIMLLSQYIQCMDRFRSDNVTGDGDHWYWIIEGERTDIRTSIPLKLRPDKESKSPDPKD